jgi:hypothetical protein
LVLISIPTAVLGPVIRTQRSFAKIESMKSPTPHDLAEGQRDALWTFAIGIGIGLVGTALIASSILARSKLDKPDPFRPPPSA